MHVLTFEEICDRPDIRACTLSHCCPTFPDCVHWDLRTDYGIGTVLECYDCGEYLDGCACHARGED